MRPYRMMIDDDDGPAVCEFGRVADSLGVRTVECNEDLRRFRSCTGTNRL